MFSFFFIFFLYPSAFVSNCLSNFSIVFLVFLFEDILYCILRKFYRNRYSSHLCKIHLCRFLIYTSQYLILNIFFIIYFLFYNLFESSFIASGSLIVVLIFLTLSINDFIKCWTKGQVNQLWHFPNSYEVRMPYSRIICAFLKISNSFFTSCGPQNLLLLIFGREDQ